MTQNVLAVAAWVWTTTTVVGGVAAVALVAILSADVLAAAISPGDEQRRRPGDRRLMQVAVPLAACFLAVVTVRFVLIVVEHPGPGR